MSEKKTKLNEKDALEILVEAAEALGWIVAIPSVDDDEEVPGLLVGKEEYIDWITSQIGDEPIPSNLRRKIPKKRDDEEIN